MSLLRTRFIPALLATPAALLLAASLQAQVAPAADTPPANPSTKTAPIPVEKSKDTSPEGEVVQMSPFEVNGGDDKGYQASSSLSGTRINSKLEDIAASISVVTKQQMSDLAATDINDIFQYEAGTEGIYQWTNLTVDSLRGNVTDEVSSNPNGSTRMRGIGSANISTNGFSSGLPLDTYNVDAVEISRGPNSNIFGLGGTGGSVNIRTSTANTSKDSTSISLRADNYDGNRQTFGVNRVLFRDKLAFRVSGLHEKKSYVRKPSEDSTRRLQFSMTARPFKSTTLRGSFESYRNFYQRPNSITPRDMYTDWAADGKPTWDPIDNKVVFLDGRPDITGVTTTNEKTLLPKSISATDSTFSTKNSWYIDNGVVERYDINRMPKAGIIGPNNFDGANRLLQNTTFYQRGNTDNSLFPLFVTKGITDKALYDWTKINLVTPNFGNIRSESSTFEIEQYILNTPRQRLALQASWLYERSFERSRSFLGSADGGKLQIQIDINRRLLNGQTNPYFLRPYVGGSEPTYRNTDRENENYRSILAYQLDLTNEHNFLKHLGRHNISAYGEYRATKRGVLGYKDTMSSNEVWFNPADPKFSRNNSGYRVYPRYYLGDAIGQNVDKAPEVLANPTGTFLLNYYNSISNQWIAEPVEFSEYWRTGLYSRNLINTGGGVWQGFFLKDRIVPTFGYRKDSSRSKTGDNAINPTNLTNGFYDISHLEEFTTNDWHHREGKTTTKGVVVKPLSWLNFHYNQSNSFNPATKITYDVYGMPLDDPRGSTRDYGLSLKLLDGRLEIRATQFETLDIGRGDSDINTWISRAIRLDVDGSGSGSDKFDLEDFLITEVAAKYPTWSAEQQAAEVYKLMQFDPAWLNLHRNKEHGDGSDIASRGKEIEINYNPSRHWTLKGTVSQTKAFNSHVSPGLQDWINTRLPVWQSVVGPNSGQLWWKTNLGGETPEAWFIKNMLAPMKLAVATEGKLRRQLREWKSSFVTNYKLAGITSNKYLRNFDVGGAVRWEDKAIIGYLGGAPEADGVIRTYDANKPVFDKAHFYCDLSVGYKFRILDGKSTARLQLNVKNAFENGRLQPVTINPDGAPAIFRIVDPRQILLTASFDL